MSMDQAKAQALVVALLREYEPGKTVCKPCTCGRGSSVDGGQCADCLTAAIALLVGNAAHSFHDSLRIFHAARSVLIEKIERIGQP